MRRLIIIAIFIMVGVFAPLGIAVASTAVPARVFVAEFVNLGDSKEYDWVGALIADAITNNLGVFPELDLISSKGPRSAAANSRFADADTLRAALCEMAGIESADYAVGGHISGDIDKLSVSAYLLEVAGREQVGHISFVCALPDIYSKTDEFSIMIASSLNISWSDRQGACLRKIPTSSVEAITSYGNALMERTSSKQRGLLLFQALSICPDYTDALARLGILYYETGRLADAQVTFEKLSEKQADYPHALYNLAVVYRAQNRLSEAVDTYRKSLRIYPNDSDVWNNLGAAYYLAGMNEDAVEAFRRAVELNSRNVSARANLKMATGASPSSSINEMDDDAPTPQPQESEEREDVDSGKGAKVERNAATSYYSLGSVYSRSQRYEGIEAAMEKARDLDPGDESLSRDLNALIETDATPSAEMKPAEDAPADRVSESGDSLGTKPLMCPSVVMRPQYSGSAESPPQSREDIGRSQVTENDSAVINASSADAAEFAHFSTAYAQYNLGNTYMRLGEVESAMQCYSVALDADALFASSYNNLGVAYYILGFDHLATTAWRHALEADPSLESARKNMETFGVLENSLQAAPQQ